MGEYRETQKTGIQEEELEPIRHPIVSFLYSILGLIPRFFKAIVRVGHSIVQFFRGLLCQIVEVTKEPGPRLRASFKKLRSEMDALSWVQLVTVIVVFGIFLIAPLVSIVYGSFFTQEGFTLELITQLFSNRLFVPQWRPEDFNFIRPSPSAGSVLIYGIEMGVIMNSIIVALIVTAISVVLGTSFAFLIARYEFTGKKPLRTLLLFPMLSTPFIGAIGIRWFLSANGLLNNIAFALFEALGLVWTRIEFRGLAAIILVQGLSLFSLVYLNAYSSFMGIDPSLEEQAENLGAKGFKLFRSVTLPLAMPGIQAGAILTFILSIEDLGTPIVYSDDAQAQRVLAYQVFNRISAESGTINPLGPAIGMLLLVFALAGFLSIRKYASLRQYASGSKGGQWNPRTRKLSPRATTLLYLIVIPVLFIALIPQISVIILSFAEYRSSALFVPLTMQHYNVLGLQSIQETIVRTLLYAGAATFMIALLGVSAAYIIARRDIPGKTALDMLVTSPIALPGIVIAAGYFTLFYNTPIFPRDAPIFLIIMSFTVRKFPFTVRAAYAGLQQTPVALEEASMNVGATRNQTFTKIVLPLIGVSLLAGGLLSFVYSISEVSTSLLLGGANYREAPLTYWIRDVYQGLPPDFGIGPAAALGVVMMMVQMLVIAVTNKILGTRSSAMTGI